MTVGLDRFVTKARARSQERLALPKLATEGVKPLAPMLCVCATQDIQGTTVKNHVLVNAEANPHSLGAQVLSAVIPLEAVDARVAVIMYHLRPHGCQIVSALICKLMQAPHATAVWKAHAKWLAPVWKMGTVLLQQIVRTTLLVTQCLGVFVLQGNV